MQILAVGSADMTSESFSASYLINGKYLVDIPGGMCRRLKELGIRPEDTKAVLITHLHGDHFLDLPIWTLMKSKASPPPEDGGIRICINPEQKPPLEFIVRNSFSTSLTAEKTGRFFDWICEPEFSLDGLLIKRIPVRHGILPGCCGYLITDGSTTAGFTGDTCLCDTVRKMAASSDCLFCDCDRISGNEKHMGIDDLLTLAEEFPQTKIIASHMKDETRKELLSINQEKIIPAADGMIFEV